MSSDNYKRKDQRQFNNYIRKSRVPSPSGRNVCFGTRGNGFQSGQRDLFFEIDVIGFCKCRNQNYGTTLVVVTERTVFDIATLESPDSVLRLGVKKNLKNEKNIRSFTKRDVNKKMKDTGGFRRRVSSYPGEGLVF